MPTKAPSEYTVVELKEFLRTKGLDVNGLKAELIQRLTELDPTIWERDLTAELAENERATGGGTNTPTISNLGVSDSQRILSEERLTTLPSVNPELSLMRREMDLMRREKELLEREVELLRLTQQPRASDHRSSSSQPVLPNIYLKPLSDMLSDFSGNDGSLDSWIEKLEYVRRSYLLNDHTLKILIPSKLKGRASEWFHSKSQQLHLSVNQLLEHMKTMYNHRPNVLLLRRDFEKWKWLSSEPFSDYLHNKIVLANRVPIPEGEVIYYVIDGISDPRIKCQARMQCFESTSDLLKSFEKILLSLPQCPRFRGQHLRSNYLCPTNTRSRNCKYP